MLERKIGHATPAPMPGEYRDQVGGANKVCDTAAGDARASLATMAQLERQWNECGLEEKVERLRRVAIETRDMAQTAYESARDSMELSKVHQHADDGKVLKPAESRVSWRGLIGGSSFDPLR